MSGAEWSELKGFSYDRLKDKLTKCNEPSGQCAKPAIKAHSIQNAGVLSLLSRDGHLVVPKRVTREGRPAVEFQDEGRNQATTFTGLCSIHDTELFRPIETAPIDIRNPEHLFLLAYRAVLKELHTVMEWAFRLQQVYMKRVQLGLSPKGKPDAAGALATERLVASYLTYQYKARYDQAYLRKDFSAVAHEVIELVGQAPTVAVSSLTADDEIKTPDDVARIALNVFPRKEGTVAVFSYLANEKQYASRFHAEISQATGDYQKYLLSRLILRCCENFVLSPDYYERMSPGRKAAVQKFFMETLFKNDTGVHDPDLYLF
jgi:hypothetical protein